MDEQLKARLIGAAILVLIAVLLVPELLSGRKPAGPAEPEPGAAAGTRSFTIELGGRSTAPAGDAATVAEPAADTGPAESPAAAGAGAGDSPEPASEPATARESRAPDGEGPAAAPEVSAAARPADGAPPAGGAAEAGEARPAAEGAWAVQVGAFGSEKSARKLADQLKADGFDTFVTATSRSGRTLHRVRVGPVPDRASAERLAASVKERKLPAAVVAND